MNNLFLKGTATGFDYKKSKDDRELQSSLLLSVMNTWLTVLVGICIKDLTIFYTLIKIKNR